MDPGTEWDLNMCQRKTTATQKERGVHLVGSFPTGGILRSTLDTKKRKDIRPRSSAGGDRSTRMGRGVRAERGKGNPSP